MRFITKIGTGSVLAENGATLHPAMSGIAAEIAMEKKKGNDIIIVSSGAVGMGRQMMRAMGGDPSGQLIHDKQRLSGIGQPALMMAWNQLLLPYGLVGSQVLLTRAELLEASPSQKLLDNLAACAADPHSVAIINENDAIATEELGFSDNDQLASLLARQCDAHYLILLTGTDGLFTADPALDPTARHMPALFASEPPPALNGGSLQGRGGVASKVTSSFEAAQNGVTTIIAHAHRPGVIADSLSDSPKGTVIFPPRPHKVA